MSNPTLAECVARLVEPKIVFGLEHEASFPFSDGGLWQRHESTHGNAVARPICPDSAAALRLAMRKEGFKYRSEGYHTHTAVFIREDGEEFEGTHTDESVAPFIAAQRALGNAEAAKAELGTSEVANAIAGRTTSEIDDAILEEITLARQLDHLTRAMAFWQRPITGRFLIGALLIFWSLLALIVWVF